MGASSYSSPTLSPPQTCLCPMLRTFSGHLTELQALVLKGALGKWLFSQQDLFLEPSVSNSPVELLSWGEEEGRAGRRETQSGERGRGGERGEGRRGDKMTTLHPSHAPVYARTLAPR